MVEKKAKGHPPKRKILVTSALIYANGAPHLGHLVGTIQTDIWVRFQKMQGHDCIFVGGSDSHGTPIMIQAEKLGLSPEELIQKTHNAQVKDFTDFHIDFDNYYFTHSIENQRLVESIFERLQKKGNIAKRTIKQLFDPVKNMFLPDRYIKGECPHCHSQDQYGDNCEVCGKTYLPTELINPYSILSGAKPIEKESEHYFYQLKNDETFLKQWTHQGHLQEQVANKLDEWFKDGLKDWDISRDAPYFGFKMPGTDDKYFYVWLDAPIGYMASFQHLCQQRSNLVFDEYWRKDSDVELYHFIGKDIIYFHALFWPAILNAADYRTPTAICVNGFLTINGQKMSKSRGTFIHARTYLEHLSPEYLRYYFAIKLTNRIEDLDIHFDDFIQRINSDLVGKFINIASRCASFLNKHFSSTLSKEVNSELYQIFSQAGDLIAEHYENLNYNQAIRHIMQLADRANQYIDEQKPWALIKNNQMQEVHEVCSVGMNLFRILMIYLKPVLPETAKKVEQFLNISPLQWQDKNHPLFNHTIQAYQPLMTRIDPKQIEDMKMIQQNNEQPPKKTIENSDQDVEKGNNYISIDEFNKVDLRIATIIEAEQVEEADKLLRLKVDLGTETRQIFAGIKLAYQPEQLVGKQVVVVANLAPRKMRFGLSEGMVLAAGPGGSEIWIVSPDQGAQPGMKVK